MATGSRGKGAPSFGQEPVPAEFGAMWKSLGLGLGCIEGREERGGASLAEVSKALLVEAAVSGRADCVYAFCRLNAEAVRSAVAERLAIEALPWSLDSIVSEVLAEVTDAIRFVPRARAGDLYGSIPGMVDSVTRNVTAEVIGFVPTWNSESTPSPLAERLAARVDLARSLLRDVPRNFDAATTRILAAQALLQLSIADRSLLFDSDRRTGGREARATAVADLLSARAARKRFLEEFERIARWLERAFDQNTNAPLDSNGDDAA